MTIREHIEAGHYPCDEKGRALVPTVSGGPVATILATDVGDNWTVVGCILGHVYRWDEYGVPRSSERDYANRLLPPPPRKVKVTRWAIVRTSDRAIVQFFDEKADAEEARKMYEPDATPRRLIVELTLEYEEPWS
jgi:hypothetical protein